MLKIYDDALWMVREVYVVAKVVDAARARGCRG